MWTQRCYMRKGVIKYVHFEGIRADMYNNEESYWIPCGSAGRGEGAGIPIEGLFVFAGELGHALSWIALQGRGEKI